MDEFVGFAATGCFEVPASVDTLLMVDDDEPGLACMAADESTNSLPPGYHDYAAWATMASWSPDAAVECGASWVLVAVHRGGPARIAIGRIEEQQWYEMPLADAPWFALATAGSLREALDGKPLGPVKSARDPSLFGSPGHGDPLPPTDEQGLV